METESHVPLSTAAHRLKLPYQQAHRLLLTQQLEGERRGGRWFVTMASVEAEIARRAVPADSRFPVDSTRVA